MYTAEETTLAMLCSVLRKRTDLNRSAGLLGFFDANRSDTIRVVSTRARVRVMRQNATTTNVALTPLLRYRPELREISVTTKTIGAEEWTDEKHGVYSSDTYCQPNDCHGQVGVL
jgi:hypothetical protein